jgi:putative membrane protein
MKRATILVFIAGILVITGLVVSRGVGAIWRALSGIGWDGFGLICLCHLAVIGLMGLSWRVIAPAGARFRPGTFPWARLVRDSGAEILPFSQLGGFVMGARAATLGGLTAVAAAASTVADVTLELFAQLAFTAVGLGLLVVTKPDSGLAIPIGVGLAVMTLAVVGFVVAQRRGLSVVERISGHLLGDWTEKGLSLGDVQREIGGIYDRSGLAWLSAALHFGCWIASAAEASLALRLMGAAIDFQAVIAVESLLYAVRSVAFAVPNAVGVQEGAYLVIGGIFGVPTDALLALSLLKRARDLTLGLPTLISWQVIEARRVLARTVTDASGSGDSQAPIGDLELT